MFPHASVCLEAEKPDLSFEHSHTNSTRQCISCHKHKLQKNRLRSLCRVHFFFWCSSDDTLVFSYAEHKHIFILFISYCYLYSWMPNVITDITIPRQQIRWDFFPPLFQENVSILVVLRSCLPFGFPCPFHRPRATGTRRTGKRPGQQVWNLGVETHLFSCRGTTWFLRTSPFPFTTFQHAGAPTLSSQQQHEENAGLSQPELTRASHLPCKPAIS